MSDTPLLVSVIIPHYEDLDALDRCLSALGCQDVATSSFEIIVADNASPIGEAAIAAAVQNRAKIVVVQERGAGPARNGGVMASRGQILAFLDSDCVPSPGWIRAGLEALSRSEIVGGQVLVSVEREGHASACEAFERVFAFNFKNYIERKGFTGSGNLFVSRSVFDAVGGFRTGVSEDVEWSKRATTLGYRIGYAKDAIVFHPGRRTWRELRAKWRRVNLETYTLYKSEGGGKLKWVFRALLLPASAIAHTPQAIGSPRLRSPKERLGATAMLYRLRFWRMFDSLRLAMTD